MAGNLSDFNLGGATTVTSLPCGFSSGSSSLSLSPAIDTLVGACTANTFKTILSISGKGRLNALKFNAADATARTNTIKITIDGVVVFNSGQATAAANHYAAVGACIFGTISSVTFQPVEFNTSLLIEYKTTITETDKATVSYNYEVRQ